MLPLTLAFHELLNRLVVYCQPTDQLLTAAAVLLVTVMVPVRPVFHSLVML